MANEDRPEEEESFDQHGPDIPHVEEVVQDLKNTEKWRRIDSDIMKRRLCKRKAKRMKPYRGAPNPVVPIVDDTVREKTNQEMAMIHGASSYIHVIALDQNMPPAKRMELQVAFDAYLRHILKAPAKIEEADDTKNCRGFAVCKTLRTEDPRFGTLSDFDAVDPRDLIVPAGTKQVQKARRLTHVLRYEPGELRDLGKEHDRWRNIEAVIKRAKLDRRDGGSGQDAVEDALEVQKDLVGITTSGPGSDIVIIWEHYRYATSWDVEHDKTGRVVQGQKCKLIFSPDAPSEDFLIDIMPWREEDTMVPLDGRELVRENIAALKEERVPNRFKLERGVDRPWPFVQPRYENRSRFYYNSRGIGRTCMDDQITATAMQRAKLTIMDYTQLPLFTGNGTRPSTNVSHAPGSFLPNDQKAVQMPTVPATFDFNIEQNKRTAARRAGALSQYEFSGEFSQKKRVQKTAREIDEESSRGAMMSSTDVDRFNGPWAELYQQIYEDLKRMKKPLPIISNNEFNGYADESIYQYDVLIVPASNAKTFNPDQTFGRIRAAIDFVVDRFGPLGVTFDADAMAEDALSTWDPLLTARWLRKQNEQGPNGEPPVYTVVKDMAQQLAEVTEMLKALGDVSKDASKLAQANSERLDESDDKDETQQEQMEDLRDKQSDILEEHREIKQSVQRGEAQPAGAY